MFPDSHLCSCSGPEGTPFKKQVFELCPYELLLELLPDLEPEEELPELPELLELPDPLELPVPELLELLSSLELELELEPDPELEFELELESEPEPELEPELESELDPELEPELELELVPEFELELELELFLPCDSISSSVFSEGLIAKNLLLALAIVAADHGRDETSDEVGSKTVTEPSSFMLTISAQ